MAFVALFLTHQLLVFSVLFALLFFIASGLMADFLDDLYDANFHKFSSTRKYSDILTVSVVSSTAVAYRTGICMFYHRERREAAGAGGVLT